jgi:hypothetical protein
MGKVLSFAEPVALSCHAHLSSKFTSGTASMVCNALFGAHLVCGRQADNIWVCR